MIKIPCLFKRDFKDNEHPVLLDEVTPGCEWVLLGEGVATRKWDGTACMVQGGKLYARLDFKTNRKNGARTPPPDAIPCTPEPDPTNGHWPHWVEVKDQSEYRWHREALRPGLSDGTYECCGPKLQTNAESLDEHQLARHGELQYPDAPRDFKGIGAWLATMDIEGIVFHHPDGRMCKIRRSDYGLPPRKEQFKKEDE
jgi:hypothetical protein